MVPEQWTRKAENVITFELKGKSAKCNTLSLARRCPLLTLRAQKNIFQAEQILQGSAAHFKKMHLRTNDIF